MYHSVIILSDQNDVGSVSVSVRFSCTKELSFAASAAAASSSLGVVDPLIGANLLFAFCKETLILPSV